MNQKEQKWLVLLYALNELGGGGQRSTVLHHINDCAYWYKNDKNDILRHTRNEMAWRNDFSFERQHLVEQDYMKTGGKGNWEITEKGKRHLSVLIEKAKNQTSGENNCYTAVFFQKLFPAKKTLIEFQEDQLLIAELSLTENTAAIIHPPLINEPRPVGALSNRSINGPVYSRSPKVARAALSRAGYLCEVDPTHQSFLRRDGITMYMEPHHLIPMSLTDFFGVDLDREQNIFSLCSNCHNQIHYGAKEDVQNLVAKLFLSREREICAILGRTISIEELYRIYKVY